MSSYQIFVLALSCASFLLVYLFFKEGEVLLCRHDWYRNLRTWLFHRFPTKGTIVGYAIGDGQYQCGKVVGIYRRQREVLVERWWTDTDPEGGERKCAQRVWYRVDSLVWFPWWTEL